MVRNIAHKPFWTARAALSNDERQETSNKRSYVSIPHVSRTLERIKVHVSPKQGTGTTTDPGEEMAGIIASRSANRVAGQGRSIGQVQRTTESVFRRTIRPRFDGPPLPRTRARAPLRGPPKKRKKEGAQGWGYCRLIRPRGLKLVPKRYCRCFRRDFIALFPYALSIVESLEPGSHRDPGRP